MEIVDIASFLDRFVSEKKQNKVILTFSKDVLN